MSRSAQAKPNVRRVRKHASAAARPGSGSSSGASSSGASSSGASSSGASSAGGPSAPSDAERKLIQEAAAAGTRDHWRVGSVTLEWFQRFARGRGEAEFSAAVNGENPDAEFSPDYVRRCRNVASAFPQRVGKLSWSHHLRALEGSASDRGKAADWLRQAEAGGWSVRDLLAKMDTARAEADAARRGSADAADGGFDGSGLGDDFELISDDRTLEPTAFGERPSRADGRADADAEAVPFEPTSGPAESPSRDRKPKSPESSQRANEPAEVVRLAPVGAGSPAAGPARGVNERTAYPAPPEPIVPSALLSEDTSPEQVGRWLCAVLEHPAMLIAQQALRRPERLRELPAAVRRDVDAAAERLLQTLTQLRQALSPDGSPR